MLHPTHDQALLFCRILANLFAADGAIDAREVGWLDRHAVALGLDPLAPDVTDAIEGELAAPSDLDDLARQIDTVGLRVRVVRTMIDALRAKGRLDAAERATIRRVAAQFGLSADVPDDLLGFFDDPALGDALRLRCCRAILRVVVHDDAVTDAERARIARVAEVYGLAADDPALDAMLWEELGNPTPISALVADLPGHDLKRSLLRKLVEVACADGRLDPGEHALILEAAAAMGFDDEVSTELVAWTREALRLHTP